MTTVDRFSAPKIEISVSVAALEGMLLQLVLKEYLRAAETDQQLQATLTQLFTPQAVLPQNPAASFLPADVQTIVFVSPSEEQSGRQFFVQSISPVSVNVLPRSVGVPSVLPNDRSLVPEATRSIQIRLPGTSITGRQFMWIVDPAGRPGSSADTQIKDIKFRLTVNVEFSRVLRAGDEGLLRSARLPVWLEVAPKFEHGRTLADGVLALEYIRLGIVNPGAMFDDAESLFQIFSSQNLPGFDQIARVRQNLISAISALVLPVNNLFASTQIPGMFFIDNLGIAMDLPSGRVVVLATLDNRDNSGLHPGQGFLSDGVGYFWSRFYVDPPIGSVDQILVSSAAVEWFLRLSVGNALNVAIPSIRASARAGLRVSRFAAPATSVVNRAKAWVDAFDAPEGDRPEDIAARTANQTLIRRAFVELSRSNPLLDPEDRSNPDRLFDHLVYQLRQVKAERLCPLDLEQARDAGRYLYGLLLYFMLPGEELLVQQRRQTNPSRPINEIEAEVFEETQQLRLRATRAVPATDTEVESARAQLLLLGAEGSRDWELVAHILRDVDSGWFPLSLERRWWAQTYPINIIKHNTGLACVRSLAQGDFAQSKIISTWYSLMSQYAAGTAAGQINCAGMFLRPDVLVDPFWRASLDSAGRIQVAVPIELKDMAICPVDGSVDFSLDARLTVSVQVTSRALVIEGLLDLDLEDTDIGRCFELVGVALVAAAAMTFGVSFAAGFFVTLPLVLLGAVPAIERANSSAGIASAIQQGWADAIRPELVRVFPGVDFQLSLTEAEHRIWRFTLTATGFLSSLLNSTALLPGQRSIQEVFNPFGVGGNEPVWSSMNLTPSGLAILLAPPSRESAQSFISEFSRRIVATPRLDSQSFRLLLRNCELPSGSSELVVDGGVRFTNPLQGSRVSVLAINILPAWLGQSFQSAGLRFPVVLPPGSTLNIGPRFTMTADEYFEFGHIDELELDSLDPSWLPVQMLRTNSVSVMIRSSIATWQFFIPSPFRGLRTAASRLRRDPFTLEIIGSDEWQVLCRESRVLSGGWDLLHRDPRSVLLAELDDLRQGGDLRDVFGTEQIATWIPPHVDLFARSLLAINPAVGIEEVGALHSQQALKTVPANFLLEKLGGTALERRENDGLWSTGVVAGEMGAVLSLSGSSTMLDQFDGKESFSPSVSRIDVFSSVLANVAEKTSK
jgi:hypothetical protein